MTSRCSSTIYFTTWSFAIVIVVPVVVDLTSFSSKGVGTTLACIVTLMLKIVPF
jgi:hypothetical protein